MIPIASFLSLELADSFGLLFSNSEVCKTKCGCQYSGIYLCHSCYVAEESADTADEMETSVTDGETEAIRI
jgi:hypothetical protein